MQHVAETSAEQLEHIRTDFEEAIGAKAAIENQLREERAELGVLEQRRTNLPATFTAMCSRICVDLNLDENILPFAAELIAIAPDHRRWEASAEMVLRSFALSLLVPESYYRRVRSYVEKNRIIDRQGEGQRLDYICVGKPSEAGGDRIDAQSLIHKLQFKPRHDLVPWLRGEILKRFNFRCCESIDEFNDVARLAMTENRHVKFNPERHQKDDRTRTVDPRHYVLGWDNSEKKRRIAEHIRELEVQRIKAHDSVLKRNGQLEQVAGIRRAALAALEVTDFDLIDIKKHQGEIAALRAEQKALEESNDAVKALRKRLKMAEGKESDRKTERDAKFQEKVELESDIRRAKIILQSAKTEVEQATDFGQFATHEVRFDEITTSLGDPALSIEDIFIRRDKWKHLTEEKIKKLRAPLDDLANKLIGKMSAVLREFREEAANFDASVRSLGSFLGWLEQLRKEDLPRHEKKFKDRLNDQVSQEIALFNTELRQERKHIEDKIAQLNGALAEVNYNEGTFMRLEPRPVQDAEIDEFRRGLRECLDESLEHTDEANEARFLRIKALVERLADKDRSVWRNKVIDVRNWYDFAALEIDRETKKIRSCYDGSSGQSGGEKAKLAFTILVAAVAYQFDVDPRGNTPGRFHFVVVDEMFSKVDDQNAKYALELFKQFGLQLLIVAPLDAKARVTEPFVDRYLLAAKDPDTNRSQLCSVTAQEYEEVVKQFSTNGIRRSRRRASTK